MTRSAGSPGTGMILMTTAVVGLIAAVVCQDLVAITLIRTYKHTPSLTADLARCHHAVLRGSKPQIPGQSVVGTYTSYTHVMACNVFALRASNELDTRCTPIHSWQNVRRSADRSDAIILRVYEPGSATALSATDAILLFPKNRIEATFCSR